jgi:hypothetical protein
VRGRVFWNAVASGFAGSIKKCCWPSRAAAPLCWVDIAISARPADTPPSLTTRAETGTAPSVRATLVFRWLEARQQELLPTRYVCSRSPAIPGILEPRSASSACSIPETSLLTDLMYRVGALPVTLLRCSVGAFPIPYLSCCSVSPLCSVLLFLQLYRPRPTPRAGECCPGTHIQTDLRIRSAKPWHQNHLCRPSRLNPVSGRGHGIAEVL